MPQYEYPGNRMEYHNWGKDYTDTLCAEKRYKFKIPEKEYKVSEILYQPVFHGDKLLWNDKLRMAVVEFELKDTALQFKRIVEPDSTEYSKFVNLPKSYYDKLLESDQLKNIPLQPFIIDEDRYGIAYSLPELWIDEDNSLNYRNKPCLIVRSFIDTDYRSIVPLEYDYEDTFYYPHFNMKGIGDSCVVVGVQRITWPMVTDKNEYVNSPENNPFQDEFYDDFSQPTLAIYKCEDGTLTNRFGDLPHFAKKTKTGYCFSDMCFDAWGNEAVYASVYDGRIFISQIHSLGCDDCKLTYEAFHIDECLFQEPDSTDYYTYNCNALATPLLNRKIVDLKLDRHYIHCLVRNCTDAFERPEYEDYNYVIINRKSGKKDTFVFPKINEAERRIAYGLRRTEDNSITPYYIYRHGDDWILSMVNISNE